MTTLIGIDWTSDVEAEAIRLEAHQRELVRDFVQHVSDLRDEERQMRHSRVVSVLVAVGVSLGGIASFCWLAYGWLKR